MEIPIWKKTMLSPTEYSTYSNLSVKLIYDYCHKRRIPCLRTGRGDFKIHRESADEALMNMALSHEGCEQVDGSRTKKRRKSVI